MKKLFKLFKPYNTLQIKLVFLFFVLTLITTLITFISINYSVDRYKRFEAPPPPIFNNDFAHPREDNGFADRIHQDRVNIQNTVLTVSIVLIVLQIVLALGGSFIVVKSSLRPLKELNKAMGEINGLDLKSSLITETESYDEIGQVIKTYNRMILTIQSLVEKEKAFSENLAHELKTPLSSTRANLESITLLKELDHDSEKSVKSAISSIDSLSALIDDLMFLSSIERKEFKEEKFELNETLRALVSEYQNLYGDKVSFITKLSDDIELFGSKYLFNRAVGNIIENGIKYSGDEGDVKVTLLADKENIAITIRDNGIGIDDKYKAKVLNRFFRGDKSRSKDIAGVGLGLSIADDIVKLFGGSITIKSTLGKGTKVIITIPKQIT